MSEPIKARLTNKHPGPRGVWSMGHVVDIKPGETRTLSFRDDVEFDQIDDGIFAIEVDGQEEIEAPAPGTQRLPGLTNKSKETLLQIAIDEGAAIEPDMTLKDLKSAIELHREAQG